MERTFEPASTSVCGDSDDENILSDETSPGVPAESIVPMNSEEKLVSMSSTSIGSTVKVEELSSLGYECWLRQNANLNVNYLRDRENGRCHSCGVAVKKLIIDYMKFGTDVLQHCICCGNVCCDECLIHEIRDGRKIWPSINVDSCSTLLVCSPCITNKHENICFVETLTALSIRCVQACLELMKNCDGNKGLRLHMGVGSGEVQFLHVGGLKDRWEFLLAGEALIQMGHAEPQSKSGEICVSPETWERIKSRCDGQLIENSGGVYKVTSVQQRVPTTSSIRRWNAWSIPTKMRPRGTRRSTEAAITRYIPGAVRPYLNKVNLSSEPQTAELRKVSVLFVNLKSIGYATPCTIPSPRASNSLNLLQKAISLMQASLYQLEGSLRQFIMDDKGTTLIGVFGLYPFAHENDALLATRCAIDMQNKLQENEINASIGVTTGSVYSGTVGSYKRNEYAVVGDIVNLSARLMVAGFKMTPEEIFKAYYGYEMTESNTARIPQPVLCDAATYSDASVGIKFTKLEPILVKGKKDPIEIYFPITEESTTNDVNVQFIGQKKSYEDLMEIIKVIQDVSKSSKSVTLIDGPLGIGKSRLLCEVLNAASNFPETMILQGFGDPMEESSSFFAFRPVFAKILFGDKMNDKDFSVAKSCKLAVEDFENSLVGKKLHRDDVQLLPLLRDVLPDLEIDENAITKGLVGGVRHDLTIQLLIKIIFAASKILVIAIENAQWLDMFSCKLICRLAEEIECIDDLGVDPEANSQIRNLALFLTIRPETNTKKIVIERLVTSSCIQM